VAPGACGEKLELGVVQRFRVEADEAVWQSERQRLRRLRVEMQADRRLPGLDGGDQVRTVLAEQACRRQLDRCVLGRRPVEQAGVDGGSWAIDEQRFAARRPDAGEQTLASESSAITAAGMSPSAARCSSRRVAMIRLCRLTSGWRDI